MAAHQPELAVAPLTPQAVAEVAKRAGLDLDADQLAVAVAELGHVLTWARSLPQVPDVEVPELAPRRRPDVAVSVDPQPILAEAPQREGDLVVVPPVLEET